MFWEDLREEEFKSAVERSGGLCVIPMGCMEKHGQHLPLGTDHFIAESVIDAASTIEEVVVMHTAPWFGEVSCFHADKDPDAVRRMGNIALKQSTLLTLLEELCDEAGRNGFRKVLILNSHGGNVPMLNHFLRCQAYEDKPYVTFTAWAVDDDLTVPARLLAAREAGDESVAMLTDEDIETIKGWLPEGYCGGHADIRETALVMADHPELVAPDRYDAEDGMPQKRASVVREEGVSFTNSFYAVSPNCYNGRSPHGTTRTIGEAMKNINVARLARIFGRIKADEEALSVARMDRK